MTRSISTQALPDARQDYVEQRAKCQALRSAGISRTGRRAASELGGSADRGGADWLLANVGPAAIRRHPSPFKGTEAELQAVIGWLLEQPAATGNRA